MIGDLLIILGTLIIFAGVTGATALGLFHWYLYIRREFGPDANGKYGSH